MTKLEAALAWARRGFAVFPLVENGKVPLPGSSGHLDATTNPDEIRRMWTDALTGGVLDYNVGATPRDGRCVIVDLDVKEGRQGPAEYLALGGNIAGLVTRSATGGLHVYCYGENILTGAGKLGPGIDTRGPDGYVVAPGSTIDGVPYEIISDGPMLPVPEFVREKIGTRESRDARRVAVTRHYVEDDQPANVARFVEICKRAAPAVPGIWHDASRALACEAARLAVSCETASGVMLEHWVPRGTGFYDDGRDQRWPDDVRQSYQWALTAGDHGINTVDVARAAFDGVVVIPPPEDVELTEPQSGLLVSRTIAEGKALRALPVPYVIKGLLGPGDLAAVLGGPGSGKSVLLPDLAFCVALGQPFLGRKVRRKKVLYFATENGEGLERRLQVLADQRGDPGEWLRVLPEPLNLSNSEAACIDAFVATVFHWEPGLIIIDTAFAAFPETDFTDRSANGLPWLVGTTKAIAAYPFKPLVCFGHHTPKTGDSAYGGQQLQAMFDTTLIVEGELKKDRKVTIRKNRMGPDGDTYSFRIASAPVCVDDEGDTITAPIIDWIEEVPEEAAQKAKQEAWLAETRSGARTALLALQTLTDRALAAGEGATPAEMMGGGPLARIDRVKLAEEMVKCGLIETPVADATRDKCCDSFLGMLKKNGFVDYDSVHAWTIKR